MTLSVFPIRRKKTLFFITGWKIWLGFDTSCYAAYMALKKLDFGDLNLFNVMVNDETTAELRLDSELRPTGFYICFKEQ